ncbi:MAG: DUF4190 domain-containing protein [Polyangiaceae bacterium]|nr:DUF4190 domain-containing protein [Myxococcales bacterium]MCB9590421.1 DUF4190 domain-containing protein [Polyangiaceae bacterium]MCB9608414.1 DUF4190 domain-containing protein [Polyangiaceae bacterium]
MSQVSPSTTQSNGLATTSLVLGLLGFVGCFPVISGVIAIFCGLSARNEISRAEGKQTGAGVALAGIIAGSTQLLIAATLLILGIVGANAPSMAAPPPPPPPVAVAPPVVPGLPPGPGDAGAPTPAPLPGLGTTPPTAADRSVDEGILETKIGDVLLVDLGPGVVPLNAELERQRKAATIAKQKLVLWTVVPDCKPCQGVAAALPDPKLQRALSGTRLVRVNVRDHLLELTRLRIPTDKIPGFALLSPENHPLDYVNGGEWDADIADNIAPVLEKFVRGEYEKRREPWRGGRRDDETPI